MNAILGPWNSHPGYLDISSQEDMVEYSAVLTDFGGATPKGRAAYLKQMLADVTILSMIAEETGKE